MPGMKPVQGNEQLGTYWREAVRLMSAEWRVEHAIAWEDEAVIEWSMQWTSRDDGERYIVHGTEWVSIPRRSHLRDPRVLRTCLAETAQ
jgi:hypothetical protein